MVSLAALVVLVPAPMPAFEPLLDPRAVQEAVAIGQSSLDRERQAFHAPYRIAVGRAPVDHLDVLTPFRRVVVAAQVEANRGSRRFGQRDAFAVLEKAPGPLTIRVELTFHPLNTFIGVPGYEVVLVQDGRVLQPLSTAREPRFNPRTDGGLPLPESPAGPLRRGQTMLGGTLVATFGSEALRPDDAGEVVVRDGASELARVRVPLAALR